MFSLDAVDLFLNEVRLELPRTPAHTDSRPSVPVERYARRLAAGNGFQPFLWLVEHEPFKALGVSQDSEVDAALLIQNLFHLVPMPVHFWKFHACVCCDYAVNRHTGLQHEQEHRRRVLAARERNRVIIVIADKLSPAYGHKKAPVWAHVVGTVPTWGENAIFHRFSRLGFCCW